MKNNGENFWRYQNKPYLCIAFETETLRTFSSAGSERLPYKQRVGGSNPSTPTQEKEKISRRLLLFCFPAFAYRGVVDRPWSTVGREGHGNVYGGFNPLELEFWSLPNRKKQRMCIKIHTCAGCAARGAYHFLNPAVSSK